MTIRTEQYSQLAPASGISKGDDAGIHTFSFPQGSYFTGYFINRDASNVLDLSIVSKGNETPLQVIPQGVLNFKNQEMESFKVYLDPNNPAATGVLYTIGGKLHTPSTDTERMMLESDSEIFFRRLNTVGSASGTANRVAKFTGTYSLGNSSITDNGSVVDFAEAIGRFDNVATAGLGVPAIYAENDLFDQTGNVASLVTYTPAAEGTFEVDVFIDSDVANTGTTVECSYTDHDGVAQSDPVPLISASAVLTAGTITTATRYYGHILIRATIATAILVFTTGYLTGTYDISGEIKQVA